MIAHHRLRYRAHIDGLRAIAVLGVRRRRWLLPARRLQAAQRRKVSAILSLALLPLLAAPAQSRPDSLAMSCAQAQALVQREGAVVIGTGPDLYERYVADPGYCQSQRSKPAWIPTRDEKLCLVGQVCRERRFKFH